MNKFLSISELSKKLSLVHPITKKPLNHILRYWEKEFNEGFYSSPMIAAGKLYLIDMGGIMHILKADKSGTIISEPELGEGGFAQPAFADGLIYLRGTENLYCIGE